MVSFCIKCRKFSKSGEPTNDTYWHRFPNKAKWPDIHQAWLDFVERSEVSDSATVCSDHFRAEDYRNLLTKRLKTDAVPTIVNEDAVPSTEEVRDTVNNDKFNEIILPPLDTLCETVLIESSISNTWSNEKVLKLIEDYHACRCLWDVTSPDYKNRVKRKTALKTLAARYNMSAAEMEKKIHNFKTSFNRERRRSTPTSGVPPKKSTWFAYESLQFLLPAKKSKESRKTDLDDTLNGNSVDESNLLDIADSEGQEEAVNLDDDRSSFKSPLSLKRFRKNEDSLAQQAVNCMKSLSEIVTTRDEYSVFGEYVGNKMRKCNRPRMEVSLAQRYINDVLFRLDMGLLAAEIPSIQTPSTSSIASNSPSSNFSQGSSNPSTPTADRCLDDLVQNCANP